MTLPCLFLCNMQVLTTGECSPREANVSIFHRVEAKESTFSLNQGFAIFRAYSKIAHFASQSDNVSEADQAKMQIVHELLNSLITNYYEVVSYLSNIIILSLRSHIWQEIARLL